MSFILGIFALKCTGQPTKTAATVSLTDVNVVYEMPATFELMNIAFALTDTSNYSGKLNIYYNVIDTSKPYYREVMTYFSAHKNHPLIQKLNKHLNKSMMRYLYNLQKAYNSSLTRNEVERNVHFPFFQRLLYGFSSVSRKAMEDSAKASDFQTFYNNHYSLYQQTLSDAKAKLNANNIKAWLEKEFTAKYDRYSIVISPLMNATHFTTTMSYKGSKSAVMWVADGQGYNTKTYSQQQIAGIYTGVVFTEIDHNYVNPVSNNYKVIINQVMGDSNRQKWIKPDGDGRFYSNGYKIFNEYMTHAVYLVYTSGIYTPEDQLVIEKSRFRLMEQRRKYYRFSDFYRQLKTLYLARQDGETITSVYPKMLEWCKQQN